MSNIVHSAMNFLRLAFEHPTRTSLTAALIAGTIAAIAGFRYVKKQPSAGDNAGVGVVYAGIMLLTGPIVAILTGVHLYTLLAHGPIRLGLLAVGEFLFVKFIVFVRRF
jgi:hypothetical protein